MAIDLIFITNGINNIIVILKYVTLKLKLKPHGYFLKFKLYKVLIACFENVFSKKNKLFSFFFSNLFFPTCYLSCEVEAEFLVPTLIFSINGI